MHRIVLIAVGLLSGLAAAGTTYVADPQTGRRDGDGSAARPWRTLEEVIADGHLKKLAGGDTLLLRSGHHGAASFAGDNDAMVTIAADRGCRPTLSRLTIRSGRNWTVRGLTISPSLGGQPYKGSIVTFGESGPSSRIVIEDCFVYSVLDASKWTARQWIEANSGVLMGRHGREMTLRNCTILNTRFGINLCSVDSLCEGNVVSDFSADGIRVTRDGLVVRQNIIKNVYVSAADGDANHDDGIQCFLFNKGTGTVRNVTVEGNIIIAHEDPKQPLRASLQGIGFFDGPLVDFVVTDNVVCVDHWHGIALYDAQKARVERNVVWTPDPAAKMRAWILFGNKLKQARDNVARDNLACSFRLSEPGSVSENNRPSTAEAYEKALAKALETINARFGAEHPAAQRPRLRTSPKKEAP